MEAEAERDDDCLIVMETDDATQFAFDEDMDAREVNATGPALGRAAPSASSKGLPARQYWEARRPSSHLLPLEEPPLPKAAPGEAAYAPFGKVPALPGVDVPAPAPFARPAPRKVITIQDGDEIMDQIAASRPRSRRGRRPARRPNADTSLVIDVDADTIPEEDEEEEDDSARRNGRSRTPRIARRPRDPDAPPPRLGRSLYDAVQTHGHFGMVDSGESDGGLRRLVVHVPKRSRGYILDIRPGEVIHANSARGRGKPVGGRLEVKYVTRHQYFAPGRAITSCVIGVPEWQWQRFM